MWDNIPAVRERIRENNNLCLAIDPECGTPKSIYVDATTENVRLNSFILMPILTIMKDHQKQLPGINCLISAIEKFYILAKLPRTKDQAYQEGWAIRRLIGKVKKITYRATPPQDWHSMVHAAINQQIVHEKTHAFLFRCCLFQMFPFDPVTHHPLPWSPPKTALQDEVLLNLVSAMGIDIEACWDIWGRQTFQHMVLNKKIISITCQYGWPIYFISSIRSCANCFHGIPCKFSWKCWAAVVMGTLQAMTTL